MYHTLIILAITLLADIYYYFTYTNRLITKFFKSYTKNNDKVLLKKTNFKGDKRSSIETDIYVNTPRDAETLLNISIDGNSSNSNKGKYNSAEMITLLWYGNGDLVRNGKCFNKDFTVLLILAILSDLNRDGKIDICQYGIYDKAVLICTDKSETGIPYYDLCLNMFKDQCSIPLHVYVNMVVLHGLNLRNMVMEDLEKKELAQREVKEHLFGKMKCNYWTVHMPLECQSWFRDYVFKDFNTDPSIKTLVDLMIISSDVLYQKNRLFKNIFGENEFFYIKKKFTEEIEAPSIYIVSDGNITKEYESLPNKNKAIDGATEITIGNDI